MSSPARLQSESESAGSIQERCPYYSETKELCRASSSNLSMERPWRDRFCVSDDHDRCAIFLAKTLRAERLTGFALHSDLEEK